MQDELVIVAPTDYADSCKPVLKQEGFIVEVPGNSEILKLDIGCLDGIFIDAKPFERESKVVQVHYYYQYKHLWVQINSEIINKVGNFCIERAKIYNNYAGDEILIQQELDKFHLKFRQSYHNCALDLVTAASDLEIKSLMTLMMDDAANMFTKMTHDEVQKILPVMMEVYDDWTFESLKRNLLGDNWAFEGSVSLPSQTFEQMIDDYSPDTTIVEDHNWDTELLKVPYDDFKTLSNEQKRQWLTAHLILRR